jgi:N-methylhydantoinase B/oxoprolinase/acetone carboxylase alpha subunit
MGLIFKQNAKLFEGLVYERDVYSLRPGCDPDLICRGVEPITDIEREGMKDISDLDCELLTHKLTSIVEEARDVYMALSISEGIITGDMNCGIFTASADAVVVGTGIFFHTLLNNGQLKYVLKYYRDDPSVGLKDGDLYFFNDELSGGTHGNDMFMAMPIFVGDRLIAWAEVGGHQGECGAAVPGGFVPKAKSRYEEGIHIPAMRIGENFIIRRDIMDMLANSVRNPMVLTADLKSRVATMMQIRKRLLREVERRGVERLVGGMRKVLVRGEQAARSRISQINDGIYRSVIFNDEHGTFLGLSRVPLTVFKEGDEMTMLVQGTSPEPGTGPFHGSWHLSRAVTAVYLFSYFYRGLSPNVGLMEPIKYLIEGPSMVNAGAELAHSNAPSACAFITQNLYTIGAKMLFDSPFREAVQAAHSRNYNVPSFAGLNRRGYYSANITGVVNAGGGGGRYDMDGEHALGFYWGPWCDAGEVEDTDDRQPHFVLSRGIDKNFHGFGRFRGGSPMVEIATALGQGCETAAWGQGNKISHNPGLFGGYAGPPIVRLVVRGSNYFELTDAGKNVDLGQYNLLTENILKGSYELGSSASDTEMLRQGDIIVHSCGGAGGYGDVLERDPQSVLKDLEQNYISDDVARDIYGVILDPETRLVDQDATDAKRKAIRAERLNKALPFDAFMKEWSKKQPPKKLLEHYGNWPEPRLKEYNKPFWGLYT